MEPRADLLLRFRSRLVDDVQQVHRGTYVQPVGGKRGRVLIGRCEQEIDASRFSNHIKGSSVLVIGTPATGFGIFPAPPGNPGPASVATLKIRGESFKAPVPQEVVGLHVTFDDDPPNMFAFSYDDVTGAPIELLSTIPSDPTSTTAVAMTATGLGGGDFIVDHGRTSFRDYMMLVNVRTGKLSTYFWTVPPNPNLANFRISAPALLGADAYWVEVEFDNGLQTHTWNLRKATDGLVAGATIDETFTLANSSLAAGTVDDVHINTNSPPFFDVVTSTWYFDTTVRWWTGAAFAFLNRTIEFGATNQEIAFTVGGGVRPEPLSSIVDGDKSHSESLGSPDPLAVRFDAARDGNLVWPQSGDTATFRAIGGISLEGTNYVIITRPSGVPNGLFDWREGDITNSTPAILIVDCADASGLVSGKALTPLAGTRG